MHFVLFCKFGYNITIMQENFQKQHFEEMRSFCTICCMVLPELQANGFK